MLAHPLISLSLLLLAGCDNGLSTPRPTLHTDSDTGCGDEATLWYIDADGDGSGDPERPLLACERPDGYVPNNADCDDTSSVTYPGAMERCNDGIVNDCDGSLEHALEECTLRGTLTPDDASWVFYGEEAGDQAGASICAAGDLNEDGYDDLIVGSTGHDDGQGKVWLIYGQGVDHDEAIPPEAAPARTAITLGSLGDLDGTGEIFLGQNCVGWADLVGPDGLDGVPDVVVGANYFDDAALHPEDADAPIDQGLFCVLSGAWLVAEGSSASLSNLGGGSVCFKAEDDFARMSALNGLLIEDFNDDSRADLAVGAVGAGEHGSVYVFEGPVSSTTQDSSGLSALSDATLTVRSDALHPWFGRALASADVNGDGEAELLVGGGDPDTPGYVVAVSPGRAWDSSTLFLESVDYMEIRAASAGDLLGRMGLAAGDLGGDGRPELVVSASTGGDAAEGRAYIFDGQSMQESPWQAPIPLEAASYVLYGDIPSERTGMSPKIMPDMNGDQLVELLIGSKTPDPSGRAFLIYGDPRLRSGLLSDADIVFESELSYGAYWGVEISPIGDFNGDGVPDLAVGAYHYGEGELTRQGAVFVYLGRGI